MAARVLQNIMANPGRLIAEPTELVPPYDNGVELGWVERVIVSIVPVRAQVRQEWLGDTILDEVERGEVIVCSAILKGFDGDALGYFASGAVTGATRASASGPAGATGDMRISQAVGLLFAPADPRLGVAAYFPRAIPRLGGEVAFHAGEDLGFVAQWTPVPNASTGRNAYQFFHPESAVTP